MLVMAAMGICALAGAVLGVRPVGPWLTRMAGVLGVVHGALAVMSRRPWEGTVRRAAYMAAHGTGVSLDRAVETAMGAAMLAVAGACWTVLTPRRPSVGVHRASRTVGGCVALLVAAVMAWNGVGRFPLR